MAATVFPAPTGGAAINWTLLGSATPANTVNTYTFNVSGYKQYRLVARTSLGGDELALKVNGLGGSIYSYNIQALQSATWSTNINSASAEIRLNQTTSSTFATDFIIEDMPNSKSANWVCTTSKSEIGNAIVNLATPITSLTYFTLGGSNFASGYIAVYGGN